MSRWTPCQRSLNKGCQWVSPIGVGVVTTSHVSLSDIDSSVRTNVRTRSVRGTDERHSRSREHGRHTGNGEERSVTGRWSGDHGGGVGLHGAGYTDREPFTVGDTAVFPIRGMDGNYDGAPRESFLRTVTPTTGPRWGDGYGNGFCYCYETGWCGWQTA